MSILTLSNVGQSYGDFDVFLGLSGTIPNDGKVGLVGPNGVGKTTLLRVLAGIESPSSGAISFSQGTRFGYLRQEAMEAFAGRENTVYAEMLTVFGEVKAQEKRMQELEEQMASDSDSEELFTEYSQIQQAFEAAGGYDYEVRIAQVLDGLGFKREHWQTSLGHLSGGQKTRALLARLLLERPDLLILDEPTNHLDIQAVEWLEGVLRTWDGALLVVSHDRYFLDKVVNRIWELSRNGMEEYKGNYSAYVLQRQERWERRQVEFEAVRERFMKELDFVKRNIARDSTTNRAKGRLRRLVREVRVVEAGGLQALTSKKWGKVMDEIEISGSHWSMTEVEQHIKGLKSPLVQPPTLNLRLNTDQRSGNLVLRSSELEIGYPGTVLFQADPIELHRREFAALIGPNGTGKTTFLRTLMEEIKPLDGELRLGASLKIGYFAQAHEDLKPENTVLEELLRHKHMLLGPARNYLAQYLFRGDDVYKPISMLSGGERGRLALAMLALEGANFLLLDEPTNHLDIPAQEVLQVVLEQFDGTILMVSHDRYLIDQLATQIWELRDGKMHVTDTSYAQFLNLRERETEAAKQHSAQKRAAVRQDQRGSRQQQNEARKRAKLLSDLEAEVHKMEEKLLHLEKELEQASNEQNVDRIRTVGRAYGDTQEALERLMERWAEMAEEN